MNKSIIVAVFLGLGLTLTGLSSCKKCLKCKYSEKNTNIPREREACGSQDKLDLFKADVIKEAKSFDVTEDKVACSYK
jgi:hypothetical protein